MSTRTGNGLAQSFREAVKRSAKSADEAAKTSTVYVKTLQGMLESKGIPSRSLKVEDALDLTQQRMKYSAQNTPLTVVVRQGSADTQTAVFLGQAQEAWAEMRNITKVRGFNWEFEVLISLSARERNRVLRMSLHSPAKKAENWDAKTRADFLLEREQNLKYYSKVVGEWTHLFEEQSRFDSGDLPAQVRSQNMTIDGFIALLKSLMGQVTPQGVIDGDPLIRISLDGEMGICLRMSSLGNQDQLEVVLSWLNNIVQFTDRNRDLYFDVRERAYTRIQEGTKPPPSNTVAQALEMEGY